MSMGPFYENVTNQDFRMYFHGAMIYIYEDAVKGGCIYALHVNIPDGSSRALAHDTTHRLDRLGTNDAFPESIQMLGSELFMRQDIRIHRMPVEYLPLPGGLRRVSVEPADRRAFKGTALNLRTNLPVVEAAHPMTQWEWDRVISMARVANSGTHAFADAMAQVLNVGFSRCMSALITPETARSTAHSMVLALLKKSNSPAAVVPDFPVAIVRINRSAAEDAAPFPAPIPEDRCRYGLVLYRGFVVGTVHDEGGEIVFAGREVASESESARSLRREGVSEMTTRMFADRVVWSLWEAPPLAEQTAYTNIGSPTRPTFEDLLAERGAFRRHEEDEPEEWPDEDNDEEEYEDDE